MLKTNQGILKTTQGIYEKHIKGQPISPGNLNDICICIVSDSGNLKLYRNHLGFHTM